MFHLPATITQDRFVISNLQKIKKLKERRLFAQLLESEAEISPHVCLYPSSIACHFCIYSLIHWFHQISPTVAEHILMPDAEWMNTHKPSSVKTRTVKIFGFEGHMVFVAITLPRDTKASTDNTCSDKTLFFKKVPDWIWPMGPKLSTSSREKETGIKMEKGTCLRSPRCPAISQTPVHICRTPLPRLSLPHCLPRNPRDSFFHHWISLNPLRLICSD